MNIGTTKLSEVLASINQSSVVKKKRERSVYRDENFHYKLWVENWTQGDIVKYALNAGYYTDTNASALVSLIEDKTGPRGYITKNGTSCGAGKSWGVLVSSTAIDQRTSFMLSLLNNGLKAEGLFVDLVPSNVILVNGKISLIDLDSFNSFDLIFRGQKRWYEKFDLNAWWKPFETANRDTDRYYRSYFKECLGIDIDFDIKSEEAVHSLLEMIED